MARKGFLSIDVSVGGPLVNGQILRRELNRTMRGDLRSMAVGYMKDVISEWDNKPAMFARLVITGESIMLWVYPRGVNADRWIWVSRGTKPRAIYPKVEGNLLWLSDYEPKTAPGTSDGELLGARSGGLVGRIRLKSIKKTKTVISEFSRKRTMEMEVVEETGFEAAAPYRTPMPFVPKGPVGGWGEGHGYSGIQPRYFEESIAAMFEESKKLQGAILDAVRVATVKSASKNRGWAGGR